MNRVCRLLARFNGKKRPAVPQRILLIAGGYLGDTFWALQVIPLLKNVYPAAEIHVAGRTFLPVLANNRVPPDCLHEAAVISDRTREPFHWTRCRREAKALRESVRPDLVIDLMCNRYSALFCFLLNTYSVGMDLAEETAPLYSFCAKQALVPSVHLAYRSRSIVKQFTGQPDSPEIVLIPPVPLKKKEELFAEYGITDPGRLVMLIPGAGWQAKQWQPEKFHELAQHLAERRYRIIVSGSAHEKELCCSVAENISGAIVLCDLLADTVSFLPHCSAVIGNDSGVVHLAEVFNVRTVSIYCATNPAFSCGLTDRSVCFAAKCPCSPSEKEQYCKDHAVRCSRPEWMDVSVQQILDEEPSFGSGSGKGERPL